MESSFKMLIELNNNVNNEENTKKEEIINLNIEEDGIRSNFFDDIDNDTGNTENNTLNYQQMTPEEVEIVRKETNELLGERVFKAAYKIVFNNVIF